MLTAGPRVPGPVLLQARAQDGHTGISTDAIDGDGLIDKGGKQMWKAIHAGYRAVSKELKGYMVDGHAEDKTEKKASSELSDYANILKGEDAWPVRTPEAQAAAEEAAPRDATNATVTPDASAAQRTITPDTSDENDDNPLIDDASDPDVDACLRVLDNIAKDPAAFGTPQHRKLRGAVRAAHGALTAGDFGGIGPVRKSTSE